MNEISKQFSYDSWKDYLLSKLSYTSKDGIFGRHFLSTPSKKAILKITLKSPLPSFS
jgi:hypothetical protein